MRKLHFVGAAGSGVSALAQFHTMGGGAATGSDRAFDRGEAAELRSKLEALGIEILPQDGQGPELGPDAVVASSAVEAGNPDLERAKALGLGILHRADLLASYVSQFKTVAVAGTSGKSTVVAMIYEILEAAGKSPSVITGGALLALKNKGFFGNAHRGASDLLVIEADESDASLTRYKPWLGVLLNLSKDHKDEAELLEIFSAFRRNCAIFAVERSLSRLAAFEHPELSFGLEDGEIKPESVFLEPDKVRFRLSGIDFTLPVPGRHNLENAVAAIAACKMAGVEPGQAALGLSRFQGVARRFQSLGTAKGVEVVDDFAHNPAKLSAALSAAHLRARRVHAIFQLHGFTPARFMKSELIEALSAGLGARDVLWLPEIYYAGGTAQKTISAKDFALALSERGKDARFLESREAIIPELIKSLKTGDLVLVMGARDPSLSAFAKNILDSLRKADV
ncbi:MAG: UDP-N-acetylmuramate--alanine ligase [Elusimicrobia bacterium]|nr:UDP-N-acetylmuramate--alanine ligase [Elusimicrobiota bacterium]